MIVTPEGYEALQGIWIGTALCCLSVLLMAIGWQQARKLLCKSALAGLVITSVIWVILFGGADWLEDVTHASTNLLLAWATIGTIILVAWGLFILCEREDARRQASTPTS